LGFRSPEITDHATLFVVGNSISFGIGLSESDTFVNQTARKLDMPFANLSFGCYFYENHDHLLNLKNLSQRKTDDIIVIQINNLDRRRQGEIVLQGNDSKFCRDRFLDYFDQVNVLLEHKSKIFLYWDNIDHDLPKSVISQLLVYNKGHLDRSLPKNHNTFGIKSHNFIANILQQYHLKS
jgi:hypothetical protein